MNSLSAKISQMESLKLPAHFQAQAASMISGAYGALATEDPPRPSQPAFLQVLALPIQLTPVYEINTVQLGGA